MMRSAEEWAQDALFEWLMTDPYPTKPGIEKPSEHEKHQRKMMTDIIVGKMRDYSRECVEAWREKAIELVAEWERAYPEDIFRPVLEGERGASSDRIAAHQGRHMARILQKDFRDLSGETP